MADNSRLIMSTGEPPTYKTFVIPLPDHVVEWIAANNPRFIGVELRTPENIAKAEQAKR